MVVRFISVANRRKLCCFFVAASIASLFLWYCQLIPRWGDWYSSHLTFRLQTDELLRGRLALSNSPVHLRHDYVWSEAGVHHAWGLGVPLLRLPAEFGAKLLGYFAFPDRLIFGALFAVVIYLLLRATWSERDHFTGCLARTSAAITMLPLLPAFVAMCQTRFVVYEETIAFGYLLSLTLLILLWQFLTAPGVRRLWAIALLAGSIILFRPPMVVYGVVTLSLAAILYWRAHRSQERTALTLCSSGVLFLIPITVLLMTNYLRFGAFFEFGHAINLNNIHRMRFSSRFADVFSSTPLVEALTELVGHLFFLGNSFHGLDPYKLDFFLGQSRYPRFREFYFTTFDWISLVLVAVSALYALIRLTKIYRGSSGIQTADIFAVWALLSSLPLIAFYTYFPFIASRYDMDFAPAIGAASLAMAFATFHWVEVRYATYSMMRGVALSSLAIIVGVWSLHQSAAIEISEFDRTIPPVSLATVKDLLRINESKSTRVPRFRGSTYGRRMMPGSVGIPYNGAGWDVLSGKVESSVVLFVQNPDCIDVRVETTKPESLHFVRARIGTHELSASSAPRQISGSRFSIQFEVPNFAQQGLHSLFLAFSDPQTALRSSPPLRLEEISFNCE